LGSEILLPGYVDEADLPGIIKMASAFVFPTLYEGFGLPILQAMAVGTPVITSDMEPHRSVAGGAAILTDPNNPENMAQKINKAIKDKDSVEDLRDRGFKRVEQFSWQNTATKTLAVISK
jgi:glycosyltransferase involved in cell wall biosynthesis